MYVITMINRNGYEIKRTFKKFINTHGFEFEVANLVVNHLDKVCLDDVVDKEE